MSRQLAEELSLAVGVLGVMLLSLAFLLDWDFIIGIGSFVLCCLVATCIGTEE